MRTATAIKTGLAAIFAVVLGLMVAPAASALWFVFAPSNAGTIQAANFSVPLTGFPSNQTQEMTLADGTPAKIELTGSGLGDLYPGGSTTAGVQVTNRTNASSEFNIQVSVPTAPELGSGLGEHLTISYATASDVTACEAAAFGDELPSIEMPKTGTAALCFRIALDPSTPVERLGTTTTVKVPLHAEQIG